ncbi:MAG: FAA hydrolase family protein [Thermoproteota archaeon]|nr:MAG: FAA hydrolase family protein [Candidatus Korarchaeota archaeon]
MKICRFVYSHRESIGVVEGDFITDICATARKAGLPPLSTTDALMALGPVLELYIRELQAQAGAPVEVKLSEVKLLPPVEPSKVICLGLNYWDHVEEQNAKPPKDIVIFLKPPTCLVGHMHPIVKPKLTEKLDYEGELAVVIGKECRHVSPGEAYKYIWGYTILNDITARDIQFKDRQWTRGKSFDTFAPVGPHVVTSDEIEDPSDLRIRTRVNGELRQDSTTANMIFKIPEVVSKLSQVMTLKPGDLIATGTPAGVGVFMKPRPKFLEPGDVVEVEIERIGLLKNPIVAEE